MTKFKDVAHLYLGCKVKYEGIINGAELKKARKEMESDMFFNEKTAPNAIIGEKFGFLKNIFTTIDGKVKYQIGRKGLQTHYGTSKFTPILRPLSSMTEEESKDMDLADVQIGLLAFGHRLQMHMTPDQFKKCLDLHMDLFGLIESGEAIDATKTATT